MPLSPCLGSTGRPGVPGAHAMARLIPRIPLHYPLPRNAV